VSHPRKLLNTDEQVVLDLRPHWWYFIRETAALVVALVLGLVALASGWHDALRLLIGFAILAAVGWAGVSYARWATTHLVLTTDRLIYRSGVLTRTGIEIPLERINTVFFRQTILERLIRSGDLTIESAGEQGRQHFTNIRRPLNVQNEIYRRMEGNENRRYDRIGAGPAAAAPTSIAEQITQLDELRQRGLLTEAEFQAKKEELLRRL
jgi:uncharacterized membrane protein YdbT with pleckstrin-like domain